MRSFSFFLALRYLKPKRTFVSIITLISILGVTLGITVLILVISVMTGFDRELRRKVLGFEPHLVITNDEVLQQWRPLVKKLSDRADVVGIAPYVQGPVIAKFHGRIVTPVIRAIDPVQEKRIVDLSKMIQPGGQYDLGAESVILGSVLANQLGVVVGDIITVYAPGNIGNLLEQLKDEKDAKKKTLEDLKGEFMLPMELKVTGIFESGRFAYDSNFMILPLNVGQELYNLADGVHGLSVRAKDPEYAEQLKGQLNPLLPEGIYAQSWIDRNKDLFDAIRLERNVMFFLLLFIVIVAAFGIMNTLITVTVQKTREIGIMKALGASTAQIVWVFLAQGMVVGFFGNCTGIGLGMILVRWRNEFKDWLGNVLGIQIFPADVYQFSAIPAEVMPRDVAIICMSAFAICSLAALIPAYVAARLDPVTALRYE